MRKVLMIGGAGTDEPVPPIEPGVERWGLNNIVKVFPQRFEGVTRWFDLHPKAYITTNKSKGGRGGANMWVTMSPRLSSGKRRESGEML